MTSRDRILAAIGHQEPDRVPLDLGGSHVTTMAVQAYAALRQSLELNNRAVRVSDMIQQTADLDEDCLARLRVDTRGLYPLCSHNIPLPMGSALWRRYHTEVDAGWQYVDEWGFTQLLAKNALYYSIVKHPLGDLDATVQQVDALHLPPGDEAWRFEGLAARANGFCRQGKAVMIKSICAGLFEMGQRIRGMENFLCDLMTNQEVAQRIMDRVLEIKLRFWEQAIRELGDWVDIVVESDDYGTQESTLLPPAVFRSLIKPRLRQLVSHIKSLAPEAKFFLHSCGSVREFIPDFIEIGVDILNPIHITAAGMEPRGLKKDFGRDICFWGGGVDTQHTLPKGTPQQVRDQVRRNIDALAPGGGWVFAPVHNIQADVPPENILAMWEALQRYGASLTSV